jgi:dethiobiotin synthetase
MGAVFVTGAGTDIGKSFVTAGLIRALRRQGRDVLALKPVASGFDMAMAKDSDAGILLTALGRDVTPDAIAEICPWRFKAPLSPDLAAQLEGAAIDFAALLAYCRDKVGAAPDMLLIEGVGGVMVPLDDRHTVLDWMAALRLPVLLVAGSYLGSLSHVLTAADVLTRHGLRVLSVIVNETPGSTVGLDDTAATIRRFIAPIDVMTLPRLPDAVAGHSAFDHLAGLI